MPKKSKTPPRKPKPLYRRKPPRSRNLQVARPSRESSDESREPGNPKTPGRESKDEGREPKAGINVPSTLDPRSSSAVLHPHILAPAHFELREDGSIQRIKGSATVPVAPFGVTPKGTSEDVSGETPNTAGATPALPQLIFSSDNPFLRLYHGNCLELLDAIAAKYSEGRFDAIFADPPYFLPAGP